MIRMRPTIRTTQEKKKQEQTTQAQTVEILDKSLAPNEAHLRACFANCDDIAFRHFHIGRSHQDALLIFATSLVKKELIDGIILHELIGGLDERHSLTMEQIRSQLVSASIVHSVLTLHDAEQAIISGNAVLLVDGSPEALAMSVLGFNRRSVEKTENEVSIRGSQQAFTEDMTNNIALLRRIILDVRFKVEQSTIGIVTRTPYAIVYIEGIADPAIIQEVKDRIQKKRIEKVFDSGYVEELIRDAPNSPFPTVNYSERPDRIAAQLLEGRVAILVENSPTVLTVPALFVEFLQVPEDYYGNYLLQSAVRILRYIAFFTSLVLPSLYVAVVGFHHELIPTSFLASMMEQRQGVPMPTAVEILIMEFVFEVLREAGLRLPRPIGQAISIVGALVIGQAAVQAKLVMASTVIVVATTGIASFTVPGFNMAFAVRWLRFPLLLMTALFGILGLTVGFLAILFHVTTLRSFGVIYTGGLAPRTMRDLKDTILRAPNQTESNSPWVGKKKKGLRPQQR